MVFQPTATVTHRHAASWTEYARKKCWIGYYKVRVLARHRSRTWQDTHTPSSVRVQVGLCGMIAISLTVGLLWPMAWWILVAAAAGFLASTLPFLLFLWQRDRRILPIALPLLLTRGFALGFGLAAGLVHHLSQPSTRPGQG
jgi:hypothetical protein